MQVFIMRPLSIPPFLPWFLSITNLLGFLWLLLLFLLSHCYLSTGHKVKHVSRFWWQTSSSGIMWQGEGVGELLLKVTTFGWLINIFPNWKETKEAKCRISCVKRVERDSIQSLWILVTQEQYRYVFLSTDIKIRMDNNTRAQKISQLDCTFDSARDRKWSKRKSM